RGAGQTREDETDDGQHRRAAPDDAARTRRESEHADAGADGARRSGADAGRRCRAAVEPERDVEADEHAGDDEAHDDHRVDREAPLGRAVRAVGGEPEEGDAGEEVELLRPWLRRRDVRGQTLEPRVEREERPRRAEDRQDERRKQHIEEDDAAGDERDRPRTPAGHPRPPAQHASAHPGTSPATPDIIEGGLTVVRPACYSECTLSALAPNARRPLTNGGHTWRK